MWSQSSRAAETARLKAVLSSRPGDRPETLLGRSKVRSSYESPLRLLLLGASNTASRLLGSRSSILLIDLGGSAGSIKDLLVSTLKSSLQPSSLLLGNAAATIAQLTDALQSRT